MATHANHMSRKDERRILVRAAHKASITAVKISKALDLPIQKVQGRHIIVQNADGTQTEIKKVEKIESQVSLKKGTKLWLKLKE